MRVASEAMIVAAAVSFSILGSCAACRGKKYKFFYRIFYFWEFEEFCFFLCDFFFLFF